MHRIILNIMYVIVLLAMETKTHFFVLTSYSGDKCASNNETEYRVYLEFECDYTKNKGAEITMSENNCTINITIYTNEVCTDHEPNILDEQCSTFLNKSDGVINRYNISGLMLTDRNYEIRDTNYPNVVYILNVCKPILFRAETHCDPSAIVCMRNDSIANLYKKSKTLGHYLSANLTVVQNESLLIQFDGSYCPFSKRIKSSYFASIEFICDYEAQNSLPILISNTECEYYFKWETKHACPLNVVQTKDNHIYKEKVVTESTKNTNIPVVVRTTTKRPIINDTIIKNKIVISTESPKIVVSSTTTTTTTTTRSTFTFTPISLIVPIDIKVSNTSALFVKNCTIQDFNMNHLPKNINITSNTGRLYSVNMCDLKKSEDCKLDNCNCLSNLKKDVSNNLIEMDFYGKSKCRDHDGYFNSVIYMKCSEEFSQLSILKEDTCSVELEWKNSAVCASLRQEKPKVSPNNEIESSKSGHHMATIISSVFALLLILCVSILTAIYFWRKRQVHSSPSCLSRCDYSKIKDAAKIV